MNRAKVMTRRESAFIIISLASAGAYLLLSLARGAIGFPLDDAWIHQVYARNIAVRGEFAFFAGQPSAGSTSPLWAILLALGYLLQIDFRVWAYFLGAVMIGLSAIVLARLAERFSGLPRITIYCLLFTVFEWHLAWSAVSAMEIPLFVFLSLVLVERFVARERVWVLGLIAGLLVLTRPEGIVLAVLVGLGLGIEPTRRKEHKGKVPSVIASADGARESYLPVPLLKGGQRRGAESALARFSAFSPSAEGCKPALASGARVRALIFYALSLAVLIAPYLAFNLSTSGAIFPNTFYAKNAEYAILLERTPFVIQWIQLLAVPWIGAQILLFPGFIFIVVRLAKNRDYRSLIPFAWILALPALYALRLPVAYQHGRYEMPIVPFIVLYGVWGTAELFAQIKNFVARAAWGISTAAVLIGFWILGANAYATDVAIIDCEMVQTARWTAANTPQDAIVAAHDIGALGYFYDRPFIDLAGLVSPQVIPFIRDESRLRDFLFSRQTAFVIVFPDWYNSLTHDPRFVPVYQRDCAATRAAGGTDMIVYQIR